MSNHTHPKTDELHVFWIPADTDQAMELKVIKNRWESMRPLVNGGYIERVHTEQMPELHCGCRLTMIVNEEGLILGLPDNPRATTYYPFGAGIKGDAFILSEGLVDCLDGEVEVDWFSLPANFVTWEGPGSPLPSPSQPWDE